MIIHDTINTIYNNNNNDIYTSFILVVNGNEIHTDYYEYYMLTDYSKYDDYIIDENIYVKE